MTKNTEFKQLWEKAMQAGREAATARVPEPMVVIERANPLDDNSPIVRRYAPVMDGVCGFAWVNFPANTAFGRWAKENAPVRRDDYYGGLTYWVGDYNQSYERKDAHATAMARVLSDAGIKAHAASRLD